MHWKTFIALAVSVLPTANAGMRYGCWSDVGVKFHHDCVVALTTLVQERAIIDHGDFVHIPSGPVLNKWGNCRAELHSPGFTVAARNVLDSFNQIASRCQRGWFQWDNILDGNIQGHAGWKRDEQDNTTTISSDLDFTKDSVLVWEDLTTIPEVFPLPKESDSANGTTKAGDNDKRQHARDLTTRDNPFGALIATRFISGGYSWKLYRGTGFTQAGQNPASYVITLGFLGVIHRLLEDGISNFGRQILRDGISQPTGSTVDAIAIATQLNTGLFIHWHALFTTGNAPGGDAKGAIGSLMADALQDMANKGFAGAVYHLYNENSEVIMSWIMNGVTGTLTALPS